MEEFRGELYSESAYRQFLLEAVHELRTPLSVIIAQCGYDGKHSVDHEELKAVIGIFRFSFRAEKIYADLNLMTMLIRNLVDNAIKYSITKPDGHLHTGRVKKIVVDISSFNKKDYIFIQIRDYGSGIVKADLKKIFAPFYRSGIIQSDGFGMGLSIADRIARLHTREHKNFPKSLAPAGIYYDTGNNFGKS